MHEYYPCCRVATSAFFFFLPVVGWRPVFGFCRFASGVTLTWCHRYSTAALFFTSAGFSWNADTMTYTYIIHKRIEGRGRKGGEEKKGKGENYWVVVFDTMIVLVVE